LIWNNFLTLLFKLRIFKYKLDFKKIKSVTFDKYLLSHYDLKDFYHAGISVLQDDQFEQLLFSGLDTDPFLAQEKAISEYLESESIKHIQDKINNRNGMSVHLTLGQSIQKSYEELIERDSFLMHFFCPSLHNTILKEYNDNRISWHFFKLQTIDPTVTVVMSIMRVIKTNECYLGLASKKDCQNIQELIQGAAQETIMLESIWVVPTFYKGNSTRSKEKLLLEHLKAICSDSTNNWLHKMIFDCRKINSELILKKYFDFDSLDINKKTFEISNRFFSYLSSQHLLPLYFGDRWENEKDKYVNILKKRNLQLENWNTHPCFNYDLEFINQLFNSKVCFFPT
jgi:hypothetical protein